MNHSKPVFPRGDSPGLTENLLATAAQVKFAYLGGVLVERRIVLRKMAFMVDLPYATFRTWLQADMQDKKRARRIQEDVEEKLGIAITESPYHSLPPQPVETQ